MAKKKKHPQHKNPNTARGVAAELAKAQTAKAAQSTQPGF